MRKKNKYTLPTPSMPNISPGATVSSTVKNVSNTGQMSSQKSVSGTKGSAVSNTNVYTSHGAPGKPGTSSSVSYSSPGTSSAISPQDITPNIVIPGVNVTRGGNVSITPDLGGTVDVGERVRGAFTEVEGRLAQERQRALGMVPEQFKGQVNDAFDRASTQVSDHRKKLGY